MKHKHFDLSLRKCVTPENIFGAQARLLVGKYVKNLGSKKVLVVTGPHVSQLDWYADILGALHDEKIETVEFKNIVPNPRDSSVDEGAKIYKQNRCDGIVAVGGGRQVLHFPMLLWVRFMRWLIRLVVGWICLMDSAMRYFLTK